MGQRLPPETLILRTDTNALLEHYMARYLQPDMVLYDVGCGEKPFGGFLSDKVKQHIGIDLDNGFYGNSAIDLVGSAEALPVGDATADAVLSSQVIEHLPNPLTAMAEAARVLKPGGVLFLSFPFLYPLHALPHDYWRLSEYTARDNLEKLNLEIIELIRTGGFWYCISFYTALYLGNLNHSLAKKLGIMTGLSWLVRMFCLGMHKLEGFCASAAGKEIAEIRKPWAINYVFIARKKAA